LPTKIFRDPYCTVLNDRNGKLLSASIAADGQWRFPLEVDVPVKFEEALLLMEDKRFYHHWGVDPVSIGRAIKQNVGAGKIVSGGSTITMQVIRLSRKNKSRSFVEKIIEIILATRLEFRHSKKEILQLYSAHAPFGGNVVGLEAACWRFFGRSSTELSWSEAALLAVLPNNPSLIHLGKNRIRLKEKRDRLLQRLTDTGKIDALTLELSKAEEIPEQPLALPKLAPHLLTRTAKEGHAQKIIHSTIDINTQQRAAQIVSDHLQRLKANQIFNAAVLVMEVETGNVLAYVGNTESGKENDQEVDMINSPRSTGSILKPFLYAALLKEGKMLPHTLYPDIPTFINGYSPKNFSKEFDGAVHASGALIRSLNIPAVHELRDYRFEKFHSLLKNIRLTTLSDNPSHYGLTLILVGAEGKLWDITGAFASMARTLNHYFEHPGKARYNKNDFHPPSYQFEKAKKKETELDENSWLSAASIFQTFETLKEVYRPGEGSGWKYFSSAKKIAWKTGTSFGFRDGWAIGVTPKYAVGVWVGNADGEGRPGLTGTETAAPILFDMFSSLPGNEWFRQPISEMVKVATCSQSGYRASELCSPTDTIWIAKAGLETLPCPYHKKIFLTHDSKFRVNASCASIDNMKSESWFVLPPVHEYYFKKKNNNYRSLPPFQPGCENPNTLAGMDIIYPKPNSKIYIPRELNGQLGNALFEATHRNPSATLFWHIDGTYLGATKKNHHLAVTPSAGKHTLLLLDENGDSQTRQFEVIQK
jgi:penicillin-binding protein 1C